MWKGRHAVLSIWGSALCKHWNSMEQKLWSKPNTEKQTYISTWKKLSCHGWGKFEQWRDSLTANSDRTLKSGINQFNSLDEFILSLDENKKSEVILNLIFSKKIVSFDIATLLANNSRKNPPSKYQKKGEPLQDDSTPNCAIRELNWNYWETIWVYIHLSNWILCWILWRGTHIGNIALEWMRVSPDIFLGLYRSMGTQKMMIVIKFNILCSAHWSNANR